MLFPVLDRLPVDLAGLGPDWEELWDALLDIPLLEAAPWTLVGGQMVTLHGLERGRDSLRVTDDFDLLVNARVQTSPIRTLVSRLEDAGYSVDGMSPDRLAHRYRRGQMSIDVLAPEGLSDRTDVTTTPPGRTLQVPGGTQALRRTELVPVVTTTRSGLIPRPNLLGAIIGKCCAVRVDDLPEAQKSDVAFLLSLLERPREMAGELDEKDRQRLSAVDELRDRDHPAWERLEPEHADAGRAALNLLLA